MALDVAQYVENKRLKTKGIDVLSLIKKECQFHRLKKCLIPKFQKMGRLSKAFNEV